MSKLQGKVAIVTGGASGIGAATTRLFVENGAKVAFTGLESDAQNAEALAGELAGQALFIPQDVASGADWDRAVAEAERRFGQINILVNNAGHGGYLKSVLDLTEAEYRKVFEVNELGTFLGIKTVAPAMMRAGGGSIVNISSICGLVGRALNLDYCGTKFAVTGLTKAAACDLADSKIRVNAVHPGLVRTPLSLSNLQRFGIDGETWAANSGALIKRFGEPHEIAEVVLFLASDASGLCTGASFVADGGLTAQ